jgi:hypothetical protein
MDGRYVLNESELCEDGQMLYRLCRILSPVGGVRAVLSVARARAWA